MVIIIDLGRRLKSALMLKIRNRLFQNLADAFFMLFLTIQNPKMQSLLIAKRIYIRKDHFLCVHKHLKENPIIIETVIRPEGTLIIKQGVLG